MRTTGNGSTAATHAKPSNCGAKLDGYSGPFGAVPMPKPILTAADLREACRTAIGLLALDKAAMDRLPARTQREVTQALAQWRQAEKVLIDRMGNSNVG